MTMKEATDFLIEDIMKEIGLNKTEARKALVKALTECSVVEEIEGNIKLDLGMDIDEDFQDEDIDPAVWENGRIHIIL